MSTIFYGNRKFHGVDNPQSGETTSDTTFFYHQDGQIIWAEYSGGLIVKGHLMGTVSKNGLIEMIYQQINIIGQLMTGKCHSIPEILPDGRIRLIESWQWTSGNQSRGTSIIEEVA